MTENAMDGNAQPSEDTSAGNLGPENLSGLEAIANRIAAQEKGQDKQLLEATEAEEEETTEEEVPEVDTETAEDADDVEEDDPEELSDEEKEFIEANPTSRLAKRIPTLTRKRKEAEERAEKAEEQLQALQAQQQKSDPFAESAPKAEKNPFRKLGTVESLQEKFGELTNFIEWADATLDENDDATNDEII